MATISRELVQRYRKSLDAIADKPKPAIRATLEKLGWEDITLDANKAVAIMQAACQAGTDLAAVSSSNFYKRIRKLSLGGDTSALALSEYNPEATEGAVRYFVEAVVQGDNALFVEKCLARYDYEVRLAARHCTQANARYDSAEVKWALVPEAGCCEYCQMIADLGFIDNWSGEVEIHEHCRCTTVPGFDGNTKIEGYSDGEYELYSDIAF